MYIFIRHTYYGSVDTLKRSDKEKVAASRCVYGDRQRLVFGRVWLCYMAASVWIVSTSAASTLVVSTSAVSTAVSTLSVSMSTHLEVLHA